jgi:hypothetical protein
LANQFAKPQFTPTFDKEPEKTIIITAKNRLMHKTPSG